MKRSLWSILLLAATASVLADCAPVASQNVPPRLTSIANEDRAAGLPGTAMCASTALNSELIVAAYTTGEAGAVRVLRVSNGTVVYEVPYHTLLGRAPHVDVMDLDGDGNREAIVSFADQRGSLVYWLFRWTGTKLELLGPTTEGPNGEPVSELTDIQFVDLNSDGKLALIDEKVANEVVDADGLRSADQVLTMYVQHGGTFGSPTPIRFLHRYTRAKGAPKEKTVVIPGGQPCDCTLRIVNGDSAGSHRASSATLTLNGAVVVGPEQLNQNVKSVSVPVKLSATGDTLAVKVNGEPGGEITVIVGPKL